MMSLRNWTKRAFVAGVTAAILAGSAVAQQVAISGVFVAQGRSPDGSAYSGQAAVAEQDGAVKINWTVGSQTYAGTGIRDGQVVVVNWGQADPVIYVIMANGDMHGTWAAGRGLERLIKQ